MALYSMENFTLKLMAFIRVQFSKRLIKFFIKRFASVVVPWLGMACALTYFVKKSISAKVCFFDKTDWKISSVILSNNPPILFCLMEVLGFSKAPYLLNTLTPSLFNIFRAMNLLDLLPNDVLKKNRAGIKVLLILWPLVPLSASSDI